MTRADLLASLTLTTDDFADATRRLGYLLGQERQIKVTTYAQAVGLTSDKQRDNGASLASLAVTVEVFKVRAEVDALTAILENLRLQLQYEGYDTE